MSRSTPAALGLDGLVNGCPIKFQPGAKLITNSLPGIGVPVFATLVIAPNFTK